MEDLRTYLPLLMFGASKDYYPLFAQYLHSDGMSVQTNNLDRFVKVENICLPFEGDVNIFVLGDILSKVKDFEMSLVDAEVLRIKTNTVSYNLNVGDFDFLSIDKPEVEMFDVNEDLMGKLKIAQRFLGNDSIYKYIYLDSGKVISTDTNKLFVSPCSLGLQKPLGIDSSLFKILREDLKIGESDGSVVVEFDRGYIISTSEYMDDYPASKIESFLEKTKRSDLVRICNVAAVKDAIDKLSPIFFGESSNLITLDFRSPKLKIKAESEMNGVAEIEIESSDSVDVVMMVDMNLFKPIPLSFDLFAVPEYLDRLYLTDEESEIILMGVK